MWPRLVIDCFLGRLGPNDLCRGGRVEERPGGEFERIEGSKSLRGAEFREGNGSLVGSFPTCIGGSSIVLLGILRPSLSDCHPYRVRISIFIIANVYDRVEAILTASVSQSVSNLCWPPNWARAAAALAAGSKEPPENSSLCLGVAGALDPSRGYAWRSC